MLMISPSNRNDRVCLRRFRSFSSRFWNVFVLGQNQSPSYSEWILISSKIKRTAVCVVFSMNSAAGFKSKSLSIANILESNFTFMDVRFSIETCRSCRRFTCKCGAIDRGIRMIFISMTKHEHKPSKHAFIRLLPKSRGSSRHIQCKRTK